MSNNPTHKDAWKNLQNLATQTKDTHITQLFEQDAGRVSTMTIEANNMVFDYSKQRVTSDIIEQLCALLDDSDFDTKRQAMFNGDIINNTERRAVLHTALRRPASDTVNVNGQNVIPDIHEALQKIKAFTNGVRSGEHKGTTGKPIKKVISIGIGGSDLGPRLISHALTTCANDGDQILDTQFVSNIDGDDITQALKNANAEKTLFVIISKSFKTQETLTNALTARAWLKNNLPDGADIAPHFIAVSSNISAVEEFGIHPDNIFPMWDWVNGRFSLWSAVGISICLQHSFDKFEQLLAGAYDMDQHFLTSPLTQNIPVLMALIGVWNRNFLNLPYLAILPYTQHLLHFPAYLQQLEMESNGKTIDYDEQPITDYNTCPVMFGEVGTNGQHSFYQLLHQGSETIPCDFIGVLKSENLPHHHKLLLSHKPLAGYHECPQTWAAHRPV
jgi:glucose-6-phosphate isomerase